MEAAEPHRVTAWLRSVARDFHALWSSSRGDARLRFIVADDEELTAAPRHCAGGGGATRAGGGMETIGVRPAEVLGSGGAAGVMVRSRVAD